MPTTVEKLSIALPPEMAALVREAVEGGEYASSSEVIRDALRAWKRKRLLQRQGLGELRALWQEALDALERGDTERMVCLTRQRITESADEAVLQLGAMGGK